MVLEWIDNLDYVTMTQSEHNEQHSATPAKIELLAQIEVLQSQVTELQRAREIDTSTDNLELPLKMNKHVKLLEQNVEKILKNEAENLVF